jgi:hypothetical protein
MVEVTEIEEDDTGQHLEEVSQEEQVLIPHISLNAIMGVPSYSTMRIGGSIGTKPLLSHPGRWRNHQGVTC